MNSGLPLTIRNSVRFVRQRPENVVIAPEAANAPIAWVPENALLFGRTFPKIILPTAHTANNAPFVTVRAHAGIARATPSVGYAKAAGRYNPGIFTMNTREKKANEKTAGLFDHPRRLG
jgi:hypothetical protein